MTAQEPEDGMTDAGIDPVAHAQLARENALLRAGVDLESEQGKIIADAWASKDPDVEAMRRQWDLLKPQPVVESQAPEVPVNPVLSEAEMTQAQERQELAAGGHLSPDTADLDPMDESMHQARQVLNPPEGSRQRAGTAQDAMATALHVRAVAAGNGDQRVLVQEQ